MKQDFSLLEIRQHLETGSIVMVTSAPVPDRAAAGRRSRADQKSIVSALRFFFTHTVDRPDLARKLVRLAHPRKLLSVKRGKGGRYRNAMLSQDLLLLLRQWWKVGRQQGVMHRNGGLPRNYRGHQQNMAASQRPNRRWGLTILLSF